MSSKKKQKESNKGLITVLIILILIFLGLVAVLLYLVLNDEIKRQEAGLTPTYVENVTKIPVNTKEPDMPTPTAVPTVEGYRPGSDELDPSDKQPSTSPTPTNTPTDTPTPEPTKITDVHSGLGDSIDAVLTEKYTAFAEEKIANGSIPAYQVIDNGHYVSALFTAVNPDGSFTDVPVVIVKETDEEIKGSEMFMDSYLAVLKERLQEYVLTVDDAFKGSAFITYKEPYHAADYDAFYIDGDEVCFIFDENSLIDTPHKSFTYRVPLSEAERFCYVNTKGEKAWDYIRTDLDPTKPMVAFTYDDGPYAYVEEKFLDLLPKYNARVTFFSVGNRVNAWDGFYDTTLKKLNAMGCEICSHSYSHEYYFTDSFMGKEENYKLFWQEINKATMLITEHLGVAPTYIRMPGGCHTDYMKNVPYVMVNWNLDTDDWDNKPPKDKNGNYINTEGSENKVYNTLMKAKDGDIVLMHSLYSWSYKATERAMKELSEKGYQFVNISELFYYKGMNPENGQTFSKAK